MLDPASFEVLRRARESAQSVEPTRYDAPPGEPDRYPPDDYPPGFGPQATTPERLFQIFGFSITVAAIRRRFAVPWAADYFYIMLDKTVGVEARVYTSDAATANYVAIIGPGGHAKIPCNPLNPPELWVYVTGATANGVAAFTKGCEYDCGY